MVVAVVKKLRICLADDHPLTLAGVKELLGRDANIEIVKAVDAPSALVNAMRDFSPEIVITDYSMPGDKIYGDGIRFVEYLIRNFPQIKLIVLTMINNPMIISELYAAGVFGVVMKNEKLTEITHAIHSVQIGNKYFPRGFSKCERVNIEKNSLDVKIKSLSPREFEVIRLFVQGNGVAQIANNLNRSVKTVSTQKRSAMSKLDVQSDQDLIKFFVEHGGLN